MVGSLIAGCQQTHLHFWKAAELTRVDSLNWESFSIGSRRGQRSSEEEVRVESNRCLANSSM